MLLKKIASDIHLSKEFITQVSKTASFRYKSYKIKKRTSGYRTIDHPARELKLLQTWIAENIFHSLPIHDSVFSYRKGRNIQGNANLHRKNNYLLRVDFADFFPSIRAIDIVNLLKVNSETLPKKLSRNDMLLITSIVCKNDRLTIGSPSSPIISNTILYEFDSRLTELCKKNLVTYSRYADDLYFSTSKPNVLEKILQSVVKETSELRSPSLNINNNKTVFTSRKRQRNVAGVILTSDNKLSIGRKRKRLIKSLIHTYIKGELSQDKASYLKGLLAYVQSIEPSFIKSLENKYGVEPMTQIRGIKLSTRKKYNES